MFGALIPEENSYSDGVIFLTKEFLGTGRF